MDLSLSNIEEEKEIKVNTNNNMSKDEMHSKETRSAKLKILAFDGKSINSFTSTYFQATLSQTNYKLSQILEGRSEINSKIIDINLQSKGKGSNRISLMILSLLNCDIKEKDKLWNASLNMKSNSTHILLKTIIMKILKIKLLKEKNKKID